MHDQAAYVVQQWASLLNLGSVGVIMLWMCYYCNMEIMIEILAASWRIFREAALYILLGLGVAGLMRVYITTDSVSLYFRRGRFKSVLYASLLGIPIPL